MQIDTPRRLGGFTLIEVMIVVAIVAILSAIAFPSYQESVRKSKRADARTQEVAQAFLQAASEAARAADLPGSSQVFIFPPVPLAVQRVANVERAQMLLESPQRGALQRFLAAWQPLLQAERARHRGLVRWLVDVDPQGI